MTGRGGPLHTPPPPIAGLTATTVIQMLLHCAARHNQHPPDNAFAVPATPDSWSCAQVHEPAQTAHPGDTPARCMPLPLLGCPRDPPHTKRASTHMVSMRHMLSSQQDIRRCRGHYCASRRSAVRSSIAPCSAAPHLLHPGAAARQAPACAARSSRLANHAHARAAHARAAPLAYQRRRSARRGTVSMRTQRSAPAAARAGRAGTRRRTPLGSPNPRHNPRRCRPARCPWQRSSSCRR